MKKLYRALALAAVTISGPAFAADLPSRRAPPVYIPPPIPVFTWTGFYAGGQIGYGFGRDQASAAFGALVPGAPTVGYGSRPDGVIGGGHIGYNYELNNGLFGGGLVIGVEGSIDGSNIRGTGDPGTAIAAALGAPGAIPAGLLTNAVRKEVEGSIRGRVGIAADRALFYATGGVAFGQFHSSYNLNAGALGIPATLNLGDFTHQRIGYTVGGGVEYAVTTNWTLRAEYRYTDYGRFTDNVLAGLVGAGAGVPVSHHEKDNTVQMGFSYLFSTPSAAPVVARY